METMNTNETITTEAIDTITEAIPTGKSGLKTIAKGGIIVAGGIAAWELAIKPLGRKIRKTIAKRKAPKVITVVKDEDEIDLENMDLDEVPDIDE